MESVGEHSQAKGRCERCELALHRMLATCTESFVHSAHHASTYWLCALPPPCRSAAYIAHLSFSGIAGVSFLLTLCTMLVWTQLVQASVRSHVDADQVLTEERASRPWDGEEELKIEDMWKLLECNKIFKTTRPVHSEPTWALIRQAYEDAAGVEQLETPPVSEWVGGTGFKFKVEVRQSRGKGRGVFAVESIRKGEHVWAPTHTAVFSSGPSYRRFLAALTAELACDVIQWAYVQRGFEVQPECEAAARYGPRYADYDPTARIVVDLEQSSFTNSGRGISCDPDSKAAATTPGGCHGNLFAMRDIRPGEEILCDYGMFAVQDGWKWFGLLQ